MGQRNQRGVILFFNENDIELKTNETSLEDICDAIENLTEIKIIIDDILLYKRVSIDVRKKNVEELLISIVKKIPFARYIKILKSEEQKDLECFIIFKKAEDAKEAASEYYSIKSGLQEAFTAKHNALKMSGKLSISGVFKPTGFIPYKLPKELKRFANYFLEENKILLNLTDVTLKVSRIGNEYINYKQYYKDVLIDNLRSYAFQIKYFEKDEGPLIMISNNTIPNINISVQPKITEEEAVDIVVNAIRKFEKNSKLYTKEEEVIPESIELKILPQLGIEADGIIEKFKAISLYWSVNIDFYSYYVDAKTGTVYKDKSL
jgi:hypothetical protein